MEKVLDTTHEFTLACTQTGACRLQVFRPDSGPLVAVAGILWGQGVPQIVHFAEEVASDVWQKVVKPLLPDGTPPEQGMTGSSTTPGTSSTRRHATWKRNTSAGCAFSGMGTTRPSVPRGGNP
jgi:hypothetical protein